MRKSIRPGCLDGVASVREERTVNECGGVRIGQGVGRDGAVVLEHLKAPRRGGAGYSTGGGAGHHPEPLAAVPDAQFEAVECGAEALGIRENVLVLAECFGPPAEHGKLLII